MLVLVLLFSFFAQVKASDELVISVEEFLGSFRKFKFAGQIERDFEYKPLSPKPTENLITVYSRRFGTAAAEGFYFDFLDHPRKPEELIRTFKVHDPNHIFFTDDGDFSLSIFEEGIDTDTVKARVATGGTRAVGIYECRGNKICFKRWPEAPSAEVTTYHTYKSIFQEYDDLTPLPAAFFQDSRFLHFVRLGEVPIAASEVILMNGQVFLVSEFMEGESFEGILKNIERDPIQASKYIFNLERFQRLAIFCLITVPEDCRPQNCLVRQVAGSDEYEFVLIDTERSCGRVITKDYTHPKMGNIHTRCHCILFCFYELMTHPIAESVYAEITGGKIKNCYDTRLGLRKWQAILASEDKYQLGLIAKIHPAHQKKTLLGMPFGRSAFQEMATRWHKFKELVTAGRERSLASIFAEVSPELAAIYGFHLPAVAPEDNLTAVSTRIRAIDAGRYSGPTPKSAWTPLESHYFKGPDTSDYPMPNPSRVYMRDEFFIEGRSTYDIFRDLL